MIVRKKSIICQLSDFSPEYPGSFVDSLLCLARSCRESLQLETLCVFPSEAIDRKWIGKFNDQGVECAFISKQSSVVSQLLTILKNYQPIILHCHFVTFDLSSIMLKLLAHHNLKVVWHFHSTAGRNLLQRIKDVVKVKLFANFFVHRFIAVGDGVAGNVLERGFSPGKIVTNQNGIDIQRFSPDQMERKRAREALGVSEEETVFLHLGYDPVTKGVDVFVKAVEMFRNNVAGKALFVIVGRNETRDYVSRMFQSATLIPFLRIIDPLEGFSLFLNGVDVLVSSSRREGLSYAVLEAMTTNKIVLCSDIPGVAESLRTAGGVWIFPCGDEQALYRLMKRAHELPLVERARAGSLNARHISLHFSLENWATRMVDVYRSLAMNSTARSQL